MNTDKIGDGTSNDFLKDITKYLVFWPYFIASIVTFLLLGFLYLRYTPPSYSTSAVIEILDKAQDSEMALPTAMTVFNRSMINLENETSVLKSKSLNARVVDINRSNLMYFTHGVIKTTENHPDEWFDNYKIEFNDSLISEFTNHEFNF